MVESDKLKKRKNRAPSVSSVVIKIQDTKNRMFITFGRVGVSC